VSQKKYFELVLNSFPFSMSFILRNIFLKIFKIFKFSQIIQKPDSESKL
jgi:hypothetical protein